MADQTHALPDQALPAPVPEVIFESECPTRNLLELIADKWALLALHALHDGPARNGVLLRRLQGISQKMLTQTLRNLERNGLVKRIDYQEVPPRVEYQSTELGDSLGCKVAGLAAWVSDNIGQVEAARAAFDSAAGKVRD
ncbi:MAG: transcriptional regulator [Alphaproteobacteria bacterium]|nr:transcriptional regulator [Alphaproteobacteria bacterium]